MSKNKKQEVPVLPNQEKIHIVQPVNQSLWEHVGGNMYNIPLSQFTEHPANSGIYKTTRKDDDELRFSIENFGIKTPVKAVLRVNEDGTLELRLLSGHRRVKIALEISKDTFVLTEIENIQTEEEELITLFACNVGRGMQEAAKIRYFEGIKQFLCQHSQSTEIEDICNIEIDENNPFVAVIKNRGVQLQGRRMRDVISQITGFSDYEVKVLTQVCDLGYREKLLERVRGFKVGGKKEAEKLKADLEKLYLTVVSGGMTLTEAANQINNVNKTITKLQNGKKVSVGGALNKEKKNVKTEKPSDTLRDKINDYVDNLPVDLFNRDGYVVSFENEDGRTHFFTMLKDLVANGFAKAGGLL